MILLLFVVGIYTLVLHVFSMNYATLLFAVAVLLFSSYIFTNRRMAIHTAGGKHLYLDLSGVCLSDPGWLRNRVCP